MKNICIRDKFNREISEDIRIELCKLDLDCINFNDSYKNYSLVKDVFYKLGFVLDFKVEDMDFLESLKYAINKFDSKKLIYLCDSYKFRFFNAYDYILKSSIINFENFNNIISVFLDLLKNGKTKNSLNLSIFILSFFDDNIIYNFCRDFLLNDLDYLEVCSFVLRNHEMNKEVTYFSLFKYFYGNFKIIDLIENLNENYFNSYLKFIVSFCLFDIKNFDINSLSFSELKIFMKYIINYKKSMDKISGKFLFLNNFDEFKFMLIDFDFILKKLENRINTENYDYGNIDIEFCYLGMCLFGKFKDYFSTYEFKEYVYLNFIDNLYSRNYKECKRIVLIYNILNIDVSEKIQKLFNKEYDSIDFLKFALRALRDYKYFYNILIEFEKNVYLTKLVNDFEFRNLFLRNLVVVYDKFDFKIVGVGFLKIIMQYEEFYNEKSSYINFIVQKILERS